MEKMMHLLGEEHPDTLTSMLNLAATYCKARPMESGRDTAGGGDGKIRKHLLGEEHPDTLTSMGNLAATYHQQGQWKEAEALQVVVMEKRMHLLGEEHPDTLTSIGNLAVTYSKQGQWKEQRHWR
jgi:hypothetical protein